MRGCLRTESGHMGKRILLVGHCNIDGPRLQEVLSSEIPGSRVERINSDADLDRTVGEGADLLLVNREPVGFDESGLDLIRKVCGDHPGTRVMLVSDYPDAQERAIKAGALPGFGKGQIGSPELAETVGR